MATAIAPAVPGIAARLAECLPVRDGHAWEAAPYRAWWTVRPAARLIQHGRPGALILAEHPWRTDVAWQLDEREPYTPDVVVKRMAAAPVAAEVLRLVLPQLDDATAASRYMGQVTSEQVRLRHLRLIGAAMEAQGVATAYRVGAVPYSRVLSWGTGRARYAVTLTGSNPTCDLSVSGPLADVERLLTYFLPSAPSETPRYPMRSFRKGVARRVAAHLAQFTGVEALDDGGVSFGGASGPFGYVAPPADPVARVRESMTVSAELHCVGIDHLVHLAPQLTS
ncbi:hypothetical protein [Streptomyces sp. BH055]|uniref:hypothetical protein n=1 Tax=unclassified Streptomyces TaxID=2593676 RepID=UPI003BB5DD59